MAQGRLHSPEGVPEVPFKGVLHRSICELGDRGVVFGTTRIGEQDVDSAEMFDSAVHNRLTAPTRLHIAGDEMDLVSSSHLLKGPGALLLASAVDDHAGAFPQECLSRTSTDSAGSAGNAGDLSVQQSHKSSPDCRGPVRGRILTL